MPFGCALIHSVFPFNTSFITRSLPRLLLSERCFTLYAYPNSRLRIEVCIHRFHIDIAHYYVSFFFHQWLVICSATNYERYHYLGPYFYLETLRQDSSRATRPQGAFPNNGASSASESILRLDRTRCRKITTQIFLMVHFIKFSSVQSEASLNSLGLAQVLLWIPRARVSWLSIWADCTHPSSGEASCPDSCVRWRQ